MEPQLIFYSDFICPFCYIAERALLERLLREFPLRWEWRGYELHPYLPEGGLEVRAALPPALREAKRREVKALAARHGVPLGGVHRISSSTGILAMAEFAREQGELAAFRRAALEAYWCGGADLADACQLRSIAVQAGLDGGAALAASASQSYRARVAAQREAALEDGITGVPAFVFAGYPLLGCQPYETLARVARRTLQRRP